MILTLRAYILSLVIFLTFVGQVGAQNTITITAPSSACIGSSFTINYTITGPNAVAHVLTAELSSVSGSFSPGQSQDLGTAIGVLIGTGTITATIPAGTSPNATYKLRVSANPGNDVSNVIIDFAVPPNVGVPVFASTLSPTRCVGSEVITYTATATGGTSITYSLDAASIAGGNTIDPVTGAVTFAAGWSGPSTITAEAAGCNGPKTNTFLVTTNGPVSAPVFNPALQASICQSSSTIVYGATATNATGITYSMSDPAAGTLNPTSGSLAYNATFTGPLVITATAAGCPAAVSATFSVNVGANVGVPVFNASVITSRCKGVGTATFTATSTNATSITYSLAPAAAGVINAADGTVTFDENFVGTATITATANGCGPVATATTTVVISPLVALPVFTATPLATRCQGGGTFTLIASEANGSAINYAVSPAGAGTIVGATGVFTYNAAFTGSITFSATATGCGAPQTATFVETVTPTVNTPVFTAGLPASRCQGGNIVTYAATATNATGIVYTLDGPSTAGGNTINPGTGDVAFAATWTGNSTITATANGCGGPKTATFTVTTNATPEITSPLTRSICSGVTETSITSTTGASTLYTWTPLSIDALIAGASASLTPGPFSQTLTNISTTLPAIVIYSVTPSTASGCPGLPKTITYTVNPGSTVTNITTTKTICSGASTDITLTASAGSAFTWIADNPGGISGVSSGNSPTGISQVLTNNSDVSPSIVTYTVSPVTILGCPGTPKVFIVTVNPSPTLTTASTSSICSGATTNIALTSSTGTNSTFSWPLPTASGGITGFTAGTTTSIAQLLTNPSNAAAGSVIYTVTPVSAAGCTGLSKNVTVTVNPKPLGNVPASAAVCSGIATNIPLTATTGAGSSFTWTTTGVPADITGAGSGNASSITQTLFNSSNTTAAGFNYVVTPVSPAGCIGNTASFPVTVNPAPAYNAATTATICSGATTNIPLSASTGAGTTFTWTVPANNGIITGASNGNATSIAQLLTNTSNTTLGSVNYTVVPVSSQGCTGASATVVVNVNPAPTVISASSVVLCNDAATNISLSASTGAGSTFSRVLGTITGGISGATAGNGAAISDVLHNNSNTATGSVQYIVTPTSLAGCVGPNLTITATINPAPALTTANAFTICSGTATNIVLATGLGAGSSFTYPTPSSSANINGGTSGISGTISQALTNTSDVNSGTVTYTITPTSSVGCVGTPKTITVTVNPAPSVTTPAFATICSKDTTNIPLTASTSGASSFAWTVLNVTGGTTGALAGNTNLIKQALTNPSDIIPTTVVYRITPTSALGCLGNAANVTVNVNPLPSVSAVSSSVICSEATTNLPLGSSTGSGSSFAWTVTPVTGAISGASSGNVNSINQLLTNTSNTTPASLNYVVTPTSAVGCKGTPYTIGVTVNPKPTGTTITPITICSNTNANDTLKSSVPSTFSWAQPATITGGITGATAGIGPVISQVLSNPDSVNGSAGSVTYQVIPTSVLGNCAGNPQNVTVVVNALPRITAPVISSFTICNGSSTNINIASNISSSVFSWTTPPSPQGFISGNVNGTGASINQVLNNSSNAFRDSVFYTITPTNTSSLVTCSGPTKTIAVNVNPTPVLTPVTDSICSGLSPNIVLASSTGAGSTFTWTIGTITGSTITGQSASSGLIINQPLTNQTFTSAGTVPYIVTPTSAPGCVGLPGIVSIKVNPLPKLNSDTTRVLCSGETLDYLPVASTGINSRYTYSRWSNSNTITNVLATTPTSVQTRIVEPLFANYVLTPRTADYYFRLSSASGCALDSQRLRVTVNPVPDSAGIGVFPTHMLCGGVTSMNFSTRRIAQPSEVFVWSSDNGQVQQLADSFRRHNALVSFPIAGNNNSVTVIAHVEGFACYSLPSKKSFVVAPGNNSINPNVVLFNNNLVCQASGVRKYQWGYDTKMDLDSALIPGATAQNYEIPAGGLDFNNNYYWVMAEFTDGCVRKAYFNPPSLAIPTVKPEAGFALHLFPNPAKNILNVECSDANATGLTIEIYDLTGKKVRSMSDARAKTVIDVENLVPGYYVVQCLKDGVRLAMSRFIKQ